MSNFALENSDLRTALIFCYHLKKTAAESHRMFVEGYGEHAFGKPQRFERFRKFKSGDFDGRNEERGRSLTNFEKRLTTKSRLRTFESQGKDPEDGKMDSTRTE